MKPGRLLAVLSGVLLASAAIAWSSLHQVPHLQKIATEVGSVPHFLVGVYPNHGGSSFIYFQETETGLGAYLGETATGKTRLLDDEPEKDYHHRFRLLDWSADDTLLLFATSGNGGIHICNGLTGETITNFPCDSYAADSQFVWLDRRSFMFSTYTHRSWLVYGQRSDGTWAQTQVIKRFGPGKLPQLAATSPHSVAWLQDHVIWSYDLNSGETMKVFESDSNQVSAFNFSPRLSHYLITCLDNEGLCQIELGPPAAVDKTGTVINILRPPPKAEKATVTVEPNGGHPQVTIRSASGTATTFVWDGMMQYRNLGGDSLFFAGNRPDGVPGVFQFDIPSQSVRQITSVRSNSFRYAKVSVPAVGTFTNEDGRVMSYHLWPPVTKASRKKHPIMVGEGMPDWQQYPQLAANAGWFYAQADLTGWNIARFPDEVTALYDNLRGNPEIDTNKVFFIGFCAQNVTMPQLVREHPGLARGLVLSYPYGIMPEADHLLLLGGYGAEAAPEAGVIMMHEHAWKAGCDSTLLMLNGVQHITRSAGAEREQGRQFIRFLSQNN